MFNAIVHQLRRYRSRTRNKSRRYSNAASRATAKSAFTMHEGRLTAISTVRIYDRVLTITSSVSLSLSLSLPLSLIIAYLCSNEIQRSPDSTVSTPIPVMKVNCKQSRFEKLIPPKFAEFSTFGSFESNRVSDLVKSLPR